MYFKDIIGQEEIKRHLIQTAQSGVLPHAQLFTEPGGSGAFALALAYARYVNCSRRTDTDACGQCPSCLKYDELAHPDLHFVFPIVAKKERKRKYATITCRNGELSCMTILILVSINGWMPWMPVIRKL